MKKDEKRKKSKADQPNESIGFYAENSKGIIYEDCESIGANIGFAAKKSEDIKVIRGRNIGPSDTPVSSPKWRFSFGETSTQLGVGLIVGIILLVVAAYFGLN